MKTISCMNIDQKLLYSFGAEDKTYKRGELIFREGDHALYYFQIVDGKVKLNNYNEEGKEFIQNILGKNQSFGDPLLFLDKLYPTNATALTSTQIIRISKESFLKLLEKNPDLSLMMNACLSQRLYYKILMTQYMAYQNPVFRLKGLMEYLKSYSENDCQFEFPIELTRQQIANLTGLRVETVIRTLKKMEKENSIKIENRRILY
ncbi:Crp/Fnr family transcriptional regulator [Chryseobacterium sp. CKR4-1]|uniref:Crp/Fnr family transcriptional regulator n=1 Tax=Chryseobacterium sp. CKR4-1 TaxID=3068896 RepID=UPI002796C28B|nr:Crp/Fnr family transcriptional regulator [Chryseobacterium sp. CKR4-1]MDQ1803489.1 Crp/Fnr family transcriptional regulator [Chryseobacterium sp. CKR4-1]